MFGGLIEDVIDDLDGIDEAGLEGGDGGGGLVIVDGDAGVADFAGAFEVVNGALPVVVSEPVGGPDVELLEVDAVDAEVAEAFLGGGDEVVVGEDLFDGGAEAGGPDFVFGGNLGGVIEAAGGFAYDLCR